MKGNKWLCLKSGLIFAVALLTTQSFASTHTIYGIQNAQHFHGSTKGNYYIQLGSFSNKGNAYRYQAHSSSHYPVHVSKKNNYYVVTIGPLTAQEVRDIGRGRQRTDVKPVHVHHAVIHSSTTVTQVREPTKYHHAPTAVKHHKHRSKHHHHNSSLPMQEISGEGWLIPDEAPESPPRPAARPQILTPPAPQSINWPNSTQSSWYLGLEIGAQRNKSNNMVVRNGSAYPAPYNVDIFTVKQGNQPIIGGDVGYRWQFESYWFPAASLGLRLLFTSPTNVGGQIIQYSLPQFTNYNYTWKTSSTALLLAGKLNLVRYEAMLPYISGGIGGSANRSQNYAEFALAGVTPRISPGFRSQTKNFAAYALGLGLDFQINQHFIFSVGYEYKNLGNMQSGRGVSTWSGEYLNTGKFHTNALLISLNYLFC